MKVILVRCASHCNSKTDAQCDELVEGLRSAGHRTELCILPPIGTGFEALMAVASHRLMNLQSSCGALICLDRVACLLRHDRKLALLANQATPARGPSVSSEEVYLLNLIEAGVGEARRLKLPVRKKSDREGSPGPRRDFSLLLRELT